MRKIISLDAIENYQLIIKFDNGVQKLFDLKPYFTAPVFKILKDENIFKKVENHGYFIEWKNQEVDLSADTLWHDGVKMKN